MLQLELLLLHAPTLLLNLPQIPPFLPSLKWLETHHVLELKPANHFSISTTILSLLLLISLKLTTSLSSTKTAKTPTTKSLLKILEPQMQLYFSPSLLIIPKEKYPYMQTPKMAFQNSFFCKETSTTHSFN